MLQRLVATAAALIFISFLGNPVNAQDESDSEVEVTFVFQADSLFHLREARPLMLQGLRFTATQPAAQGGPRTYNLITDAEGVTTGLRFSRSQPITLEWHDQPTHISNPDMGTIIGQKVILDPQRQFFDSKSLRYHYYAAISRRLILPPPSGRFRNMTSDGVGANWMLAIEERHNVTENFEVEVSYAPLLAGERALSKLGLPRGSRLPIVSGIFLSTPTNSDIRDVQLVLNRVHCGIRNIAPFIIPVGGSNGGAATARLDYDRVTFEPGQAFQPPWPWCAGDLDRSGNRQTAMVAGRERLFILRVRDLVPGSRYFIGITGTPDAIPWLEQQGGDSQLNSGSSDADAARCGDVASCKPKKAKCTADHFTETCDPEKPRVGWPSMYTDCQVVLRDEKIDSVLSGSPACNDCGGGSVNIDEGESGSISLSYSPPEVKVGNKKISFGKIGVTLKGEKWERSTVQLASKCQCGQGYRCKRATIELYVCHYNAYRIGTNGLETVRVDAPRHDSCEDSGGQVLATCTDDRCLNSCNRCGGR